MPLIVLPKSCSCRWGPCPPPIPRLGCVFCFFLSFYTGHGTTPSHNTQEFASRVRARVRQSRARCCAKKNFIYAGRNPLAQLGWESGLAGAYMPNTGAVAVGVATFV